MGKVLVLYDSASGNTAKMAELVAVCAGGIAGIEVRLRKVDDASADDVLWCDGLALGSPTNMGVLSWKMKRFWDEPMAPHWMKVDGKIALRLFLVRRMGRRHGARLPVAAHGRDELRLPRLRRHRLRQQALDGSLRCHLRPRAARRGDRPRPAGLLGKRLCSGSPSSATAAARKHPLTKSDVRLPPG